MIHTFEIDGLIVQTGDVFCTRNGKPDILPGEFWRLVGRLVPGDVDHVAIYLGPGSRCAEAGAHGVILFDVPSGHWDSEKMVSQRGHLLDELIGAAYPLEGRGYLPDEQVSVRQEVAAFCLAQVGKPYNMNFLDPEKEDAYYCSQLVYKAYLGQGIDLNTGLAMESLPGTNRIIYPQEIWSGCVHREIVR
jgi:Permuted papain-like amidase enzyme, YaeF/YiiX, C92 family